MPASTGGNVMPTRRWAILAAGAASVLGGALFVYATSASAATTDYQAENATISKGAVQSHHAGYTGTGCATNDNVTGSNVEWPVTAPAAGTATLTVRYANGTTANRPMTIAANGATGTTVAFPGTGAWTIWTEATTTAPLK